MSRWVTTWFYEQDAGEGGSYAQVRGDSSTQGFRDVYRRCLATFFATARRAEPDARLVLYLNRPWDPGASATAAAVLELLDRFGVERQVLAYAFAPPDGWPSAWRNQFFVLDVLTDLAERADAADQVLVLDSDIVWTQNPTDDLWATVGEDGAATYLLDYPPDHAVNGCSRRQLTALAQHLGVTTGPGLVSYSGGELVALRGDVCARVVATAGRLWPQVHRARDEGVAPALEEAHLLSLCYATLDLPVGTANRWIKRMWTQPFKHQNVEPADLDLALWHVPAEKKYGLRRLYADLRGGADAVRSGDDAAYRRHLARRLGVPRNTPQKVASDAAGALTERVLTKLRP